MAPHEAYIAFLGQLSETLDQLTAVEKEKTDAVRRDDLTALNECMKREQAMSLTLRSMDQKRMKLLKELGMETVTLANFSASCPEGLRPEARAATEKLRNSYAIYRSAADLSRHTLERSLRQIDAYLSEKSGGEPPVEDRGVRDVRI